MRSLFDWRRRAPAPAATDLSAPDLSATGAPNPSPAEHEAASRDAYDRGRRDERARRPGFSLVSAVVLMAAVVGGGAIILAAREGSFTAGGQVVDRQLSTAANRAKVPLRGAADRAGDALETAGQTLKDRARDRPADHGRQQASND